MAVGPRRISSDRGGTNTFGTIVCPYNSNGIFNVIYEFLVDSYLKQ
jgi:hypothetical protein